MDKDYKKTILNDEILKQILPILSNENAYLVGGYVRDLFLTNKISQDRDIVIFSDNILELSKKIQAAIGGFWVELDNENKIYRIIAPNKTDYVDIAKGVGENIEQDLKRRDFTINALAIDLKNMEIIDIFDGLRDLKEKKIVPISEQNFLEDALRMLRAPRFQAVLGFDFDDKLIDFARQNSNFLDKIAKERINYELMRIFEGKYTTSGLLSLDKMGLIDKFFPEMKDVKKIPKNSHHHLPLFFHSLETVKFVQSKIETSNTQEFFESKNLGEHKRIAYLKLAAFLHDIGKPSTWTIEPDTGRHRFIKHDEVGSKLAVPLLKNLKFSNKQIKYVQKVIKYHIYPSALLSNEGVSEKTLNRYFRKIDEEALDIIFLAMADRLSARGEAITDEMVEKNIQHLEFMKEYYFNTFLNQKPLEKLLDGNEIMEILNIEKSPKLGQIINALKEAQINLEVVTKKDAIDFVKNYATKYL